MVDKCSILPLVLSKFWVNRCWVYIFMLFYATPSPSLYLPSCLIRLSEESLLYFFLFAVIPVVTSDSWYYKKTNCETKMFFSELGLVHTSANLWLLDWEMKTSLSFVLWILLEQSMFRFSSLSISWTCSDSCITFNLSIVLFVRNNWTPFSWLN